MSGVEFDLGQVKQARKAAIEYVQNMNLYETVAMEECYKKTGKAPIAVRWIDINTGDKNHPNYRSGFGRKRDQHIQEG